jgi:DNA primase
MIDRATIDKVFDAAQIIEVVQEFVSLKKRGVNYLGLCPFHNEKTPSFTVSPAKNIYKCFGCGKGGNPVNFLMELEHLSYTDAIRWLAKKYHIEIVEKEETAEEVQQKNERESMLILTQYAQRIFVENLFENREGQSIGLSYYKERGFREEIIRKFGLGYALASRDAFSQKALRDGYQKEYLLSTGLSIEGEHAIFDRFSGRVMFPVYDLMGKVIAFGGRILKSDAKAAKYQNSPESDIYQKRKALYGLFQAKKAILQEDKCFLVEGYTDVLSMHQAGIEHVVASSGTSLTEDQIRLMKRFTSNVTVLYDGDSAGIKAALRGIDLMLEEGMNVKVLLLPDGEDPDSFARHHSSSELSEYLQSHETDFITFKTKLLLDEAQQDPIKRARLITDVVHSISLIPDGIIRSVYVKDCSRMLDSDEQMLIREVAKRRRMRQEERFHKESQNFSEAVLYSQEENPPLPSRSEDDLEIAEKEVIRLLITYGSETIWISEEEPSVKVSDFFVREIEADELSWKNPLYRQVYQEIRLAVSKGVYPESRYFITHIDPSVSSLAADLLSSHHNLSSLWKSNEVFARTEDLQLREIVPLCLFELKSKKVMALLRDLNRTLAGVKDEDQIRELMNRCHALNEVKMELAKSLGQRVIL